MLRKIIQRWKRWRENRAVILMFHQVCDRDIDPWELAVSPARFEEQLRALKNEFEVCSMDDLLSALPKEQSKRKMVAITFDDGFQDNYMYAAPLLEWYKLPATFYIASGVLKPKSRFWWEELQAYILQSKHLPARMSLDSGVEIIDFRFRRSNILTPVMKSEIARWRWGNPVRNERVKLFLHLWQKLRPLPLAQQRYVLDEIKMCAGVLSEAHHPALVDSRQIKNIADNPLFEIGAHTVNHVMLPSQTPSCQRNEIEQSKSDLEQIIGKRVSGFAYPYGNHDGVTRALLSQCGFRYGVTTDGMYARSHSDPYALPRIQVKNWSPSELTFRVNELLQ